MKCTTHSCYCTSEQNSRRAQPGKEYRVKFTTPSCYGTAESSDPASRAENCCHDCPHELRCRLQRELDEPPLCPNYIIILLGILAMGVLALIANL